MKVNAKHSDQESIRRQMIDTDAFLQTLSQSGRRPCPGCALPCACSASTTCACGCAPECEQCPARMSSEPDRYPIETNIVPLVYAFYDSHIYDPCWSCEGHLDGAGDHLQKIPRVWFYASSMVFPRLLVEYLDDLRFKKKIRHPWGVRILSWSDTSEARFSIEPVSPDRRAATLTELHQDVLIIARSLKTCLYESGLEYRRRLQSL